MTAPSTRTTGREAGGPRLAFGGETWREVLFLLLNLPLDIIGFVYAVTMLSVGAGLAVTVVGAPLLCVGLLGCRAAGHVERARARALLDMEIDDPSPRRPREPGFLAWTWAGLSDRVAWRHALYLIMRLPWGLFTFVVTLVCLVVGWPVLPWVVRALATVDRMMVRALLSPDDELERRIRQLESDRGVVVDTAAADLRRIERDLHDGAQARLVALAMDLGLAKEKLHDDPETAARMVDEAHGEVKLALQELRDLARGIHPAVLTDRGLDAALSSLAARCTVPVRVTVDLPTRPAPALEGIAYFTVAELLTNISKHSHAHTATIDMWRSDHRLLLHIRDDGHGGATPTPGSGLAGLTERLQAVDGLLIIDSPHGGPTHITAELPWRDRTPTT